MERNGVVEPEIKDLLSYFVSLLDLHNGLLKVWVLFQFNIFVSLFYYDNLRWRVTNVKVPYKSKTFLFFHSN